MSLYGEPLTSCPDLFFIHARVCFRCDAALDFTRARPYPVLPTTTKRTFQLFLSLEQVFKAGPNIRVLVSSSMNSALFGKMF